MSRESFISDMRTALQREIRLSNRQPDRRDVLDYFRGLHDRQRAVEIYTDYARSFYTHAMFVPGTRDGDVRWPGGSCDRWSEVVSRPRYQSQRIIDCEGFAFLASELLGAAGWRLIGYQVIYRPATQSSEMDYHLVAILNNPSDSWERIYVGTPRPSPSAITEASRIWPDAAFDVRFSEIALDARRAIRDAAESTDADAPREVAPMRRRRSVVPPPI